MGQISQMKLAMDIGVSRDCIFDYTREDYPEKSMQVETLKRLAEYFEVDQYHFCNEYHRFIDTVNVGEYLKGRRKKAGMSQREFAESMNVALVSYKQYERGAVRIPEPIWRITKDK